LLLFFNAACLVEKQQMPPRWLEEFQRFPVSTNQSDALMATLNEGQGQQTQFFKNHPEQDIRPCFSGESSRSSRSKPPTMGNQLVNSITCGCESSA
jgi:hypothetical protein